jgi:hypothetical protein
VVNKGGLDDILAEQQLIATMARAGWGGTGVRARATPPLEKIQGSPEVIEFLTKVPPAWRGRPGAGEVEWSIQDGDRLDICVTRIKDPTGIRNLP